MKGFTVLTVLVMMTMPGVVIANQQNCSFRYSNPADQAIQLVRATGDGIGRILATNTISRGGGLLSGNRIRSRTDTGKRKLVERGLQFFQSSCTKTWKLIEEQRKFQENYLKLQKEIELEKLKLQAKIKKLEKEKAQLEKEKAQLEKENLKLQLKLRKEIKKQSLTSSI